MKYFSVLIALLLATLMSAQERPKLFLDCRTNCDMRYFKTEINFVDFMLDRQSAELYILLVRQSTGSGGREFTMTVENKKSGLEPYEMKFFTDVNALEDDIRKEILKNLKKALLKYMVCEDLLIDIDYTIDLGNGDQEEEVLEDPWNAWIFSLGVNGNLNKESQFSSQWFNFNASANRITDQHKFLGRVNHETSENSFIVGDGEEKETITNVQTSYFGRLLYVYSLTDHWSAGGILRYSRSIFQNYDHSLTVSPALEYNIFPYDEVADHNFTFRYEIGQRYNDYIDTTVYLQITERLWRHRLAIDYQIIKPWGNIDIDAGVSQFLSRPDRYSIDISPSIDVNIFKGLNFYTGFYYGITKDRINIPKGDLSVEDILLQNTLQDSNFSLSMYFGMRYRFGSASNNVVNTRF